LWYRAGSIVGALYHKLETHSSAPEDGRNYRLKHVELIAVINKLLLLHLVGCLYYFTYQYTIGKEQASDFWNSMCRSKSLLFYFNNTVIQSHHLIPYVCKFGTRGSFVQK